MRAFMSRVLSNSGSCRIVRCCTCGKGELESRHVLRAGSCNRSSRHVARYVVKRSAIISDCGRYRYVLERQWEESYALTQTVTFVMLNPSTADANKDDPTIRRCIGFAKQWGAGRIVVVNLFAYRATNPKELLNCPIDPVGPYNDRHVWLSARQPLGCVVAAWGSLAGERFASRVKHVAEMIGRPLCAIATTKDGHPSHPLYLRTNSLPIDWWIK